MMPSRPVARGAEQKPAPADDITHRSRVYVVVGGGRRVDEDKIIEIRKTVGEGMGGITERDTQLHCMDKGQGEGGDGREDTETRGT